MKERTTWVNMRVERIKRKKERKKERKNYMGKDTSRKKERKN